MSNALARCGSTERGHARSAAATSPGLAVRWPERCSAYVSSGGAYEGCPTATSHG